MIAFLSRSACLSENFKQTNILVQVMKFVFIVLPEMGTIKILLATDIIS